jgi:uncharacterized protein (DUF2147 family)
MTRLAFRIALGAALAALLPAAPSAATAPPIFGRWRTDDGSAIIRVEPCGHKLCGSIERVLDPRAPPNDIYSPDPAHRSKPLVGTMVLSSFTGAGSAWDDGSAYDPKAGRSYHSQLRLLGDGRLKVTGCVLIICRSRYWTRAK